MKASDVAAIIVIGPIAICYWAAAIRILYNLICHGRFEL